MRPGEVGPHFFGDGDEQDARDRVADEGGYEEHDRRQDEDGGVEPEAVEHLPDDAVQDGEQPARVDAFAERHAAHGEKHD